MAVTENTVTIPARNLRGDALALTVVERADLVRIQTDGDAIIMSPHAAAELVMQLLHALGGRLVPPVLSGRL